MSAHVVRIPRASHRWSGLRWLLAGALVVGAIGIAAALATGRLSTTPAAPAAPAAAPARANLQVRGTVMPVRWARVASLEGGRVAQVLVDEGQDVVESQELMRVDAGGHTVSLLAPYAGTVAKLEYRLGDTVPPGQTAVIVGDLSQFQIETTDLDEFTVGRVHVGQVASIRFDAVEGAPVAGVISRISAIAQTRSTGEVTYPTVIDFDPPASTLRWGMTARISIEE